jgi:hypothetical protein
MEIRIISNYYFWYLILALAGVVVGIISYRQTFPPLNRLWKTILSALRAVMIILIGILIIEPILNLYSTQTINPRLAVLIDISGSMGVRDGSSSRISYAAEMVSRQLDQISGKYRLFEFSTGLAEADRMPSESDLSGDATSIANALEDFKNHSDNADFGAILLVTDGRQNLGDDPLSEASALNIPIHTLTVGQRVEEKNLAIENIIYPAVAYSGVNFNVEADISANGMERGKSRLIMRLGTKGVADKQFDLPEENRKVRINFDIQAPEPGNYEYSLSTPVFDGEANRVDNERLFAVRVLKNRLKVLLISSTLDWEYKFARQMIEQFDEFELDAVYPELGGRFSDPGIPQGLDGLKKYDVVFMVNSSPPDVRISNIDLKKYVDEGGSLIYVAGFDSPNDLRLFETLLPVKGSNVQIEHGEYFYEPSPTRKQHAAILLDDDPDASRRTWRSLPPFSTLLGNLEPTGEVLLEAGMSSRDSLLTRKKSVDGKTDVRPVITVGPHGNGKTIAITGFPWWRSYFGTINNERLSGAFPEFWRNLIKWSAATDDMKNFKIVSDREVYRLGEAVRLTGYLYDESNRPRNGAFISLTIISDADPSIVKDAVLPQIDNGIYSEQVTSLPAGHYKYKAIATAYGDTLGTTDGEFSIESFSLEMASSAPDYNLTRRISDGTGGKAYTFENIGNFAADLKLEPFEQENQASIRPFGMPLLLAILILGLCLEWGLRKRFRLP